MIDADSSDLSPLSEITETTPEEITVTEEEIPSQADLPDEAEALRRELSDLRAYIEDQKAKEEKALFELEEFRRLFPDVSIDSIEEAIWERVRDGLPLSAAYAVCQREKELQKTLAEQINIRNSAASAGSAGAPLRLDYFSPDEVKAMSGEEVRQNYANIRRSMDYWRKASK